ncbi:hypothetical protein HK098_001960 [Nowakowskiella sp. JEL0407]|nr:hypothetical protein HK098_001960 [Nowakowskiella sp. JEL0407]
MSYANTTLNISHSHSWDSPLPPAQGAGTLVVPAEPSKIMPWNWGINKSVVDNTAQILDVAQKNISDRFESYRKSVSNALVGAVANRPFSLFTKEKKPEPTEVESIERVKSPTPIVGKAAKPKKAKEYNSRKVITWVRETVILNDNTRTTSMRSYESIEPMSPFSGEEDKLISKPNTANASNLFIPPRPPNSISPLAKAKQAASNEASEKRIMKLESEIAYLKDLINSPRFAAPPPPPLPFPGVPGMPPPPPPPPPSRSTLPPPGPPPDVMMAMLSEMKTVKLKSVGAREIKGMKRKAQEQEIVSENDDHQKFLNGIKARIAATAQKKKENAPESIFPQKDPNF